MHTMKKLLFIFPLIFAERVLADDLSVSITNSTAGLNNGAIDLTVDGGVAPYLFQWTGPNGYSSSDEDIASLEPGEYCVTVTDLYCGTASLCVVVEEDVASGMVNHQMSTLSVYPNPFCKEFSIVFDSQEQGEHLFYLYDLSGKVVWIEPRTLALGMNACHFLLTEDIAAGRYELIVRDKKGSNLQEGVVRIW